MREWVAKYPNAVRVVHRHFPLDNQCNSLIQRPFHAQACAYARLAACASLVGRFWEANDYLFDHAREAPTITAEVLAKAIGVDVSTLSECVDKSGAEIVQNDVEEGLKFKIQGTPSFVVNGTMYKGQVPDEILEPYTIQSPR